MLSLFTLDVYADTPKVPVTLDNIRTVETHMQFERYQKICGGINKLFHFRVAVDIDKQSTIAMNRDTLYSMAVLDLAKPVTITLPEMGKRPVWLQIIDEDHYSFNEYTKAGSYTFTEKEVGTRYAVAIIRTFMDPDSKKDMDEAHAFQDGITLKAGSNVPFVRPNYDETAYKALFKQIQPLISFAGKDTIGAMGKRGEVKEIRHLLATIAGWGLLPAERAMYQPVQPNLPEDKTYVINVPADVPVKAFWSISMYNAEGFFQKNDLGAYSINSVTAEKNDDGTVTIQLGGCEKSTKNCLPIAGKGWYYQWRMYDPEEAMLKGEFTFPMPSIKE